LLMRMYDVDSGSITIDGTDIRNLPVHAFRSQIGFVPQDVFLFSDTLANNIAFGLDETRMEEVEEAAKRAAVYDNIAAFEKGFETAIGERGITLSGGQKQRVSIARAITINPKILIFDDCLSAVDTKTEEKILQNLGTVMRDRSAI